MQFNIIDTTIIAIIAIAIAMHHRRCPHLTLTSRRCCCCCYSRHLLPPVVVVDHGLDAVVATENLEDLGVEDEGDVRVG